MNLDIQHGNAATIKTVGNLVTSVIPCKNCISGFMPQNGSITRSTLSHLNVINDLFLYHPYPAKTKNPKKTC